MPAATSQGTDSTGIQRRDDLVNAEVNALHTPAQGHANLVS